MKSPGLQPPDIKPKFNLNQTLLAWEEHLLASHHFAVDRGGALWRYLNGRYVPNADGYIQQWLYDKFKTSPDRMHWAPSHATRLIAAAKLTAPILWERPHWDTINLQNCQLKWSGSRWDKMSHSASWLSPLQLNVAYDPSADCPNWRQFIADLLPDEDPDFTFKLIASLMSTAHNNNQQAYLCLGETGGEGKSTYIKAIQTFLGPDACVTRNLQSLEDNRFATVDLQGKLALLDSDMETRVFKTTATFKRIVTQDAIQAEYKGGAQFSFVPFCKILMASNRIPTSQESGHAWSRRWCVIPFKKTLPADKRRPPAEMENLLTNATELSGLLNAVLPHLHSVSTQGLKTEASWADMINQEGFWHDYTEAWIKQTFEYRAENLLLPAEVRRRYVDWCEARSRAPLSRGAFTAIVNRLFPRTITSFRPAATAPGAERPYYWKHLAFRS